MLRYAARILKDKTKTINGKKLFPMIISTNDVDRVGDIMDIAGADLTEYKMNPVVMNNHWRPTIGVTEKIETINNSKLLAWFWFDEITKESQERKAQIESGSVRTSSIGFEPIEWEDVPIDATNIDLLKGRTRWINSIRKYTKWILIEWSVVDIPANTQAQILRAYFKGIQPEEIEKQFQTKIDKNFLEEETKKILKGLNMPINNETIKDEIRKLNLKAGAVLSAANKSKLQNAVNEIQSVLDAAAPEEDSTQGGKTIQTISTKEELLKFIQV